MERQRNLHNCDRESGMMTCQRRRRPIPLGVVLLALLGLVVLYALPARLPSGSNAAALQPPAGVAETVRIFFTTPTLHYPDIPARRTIPPLLEAVLADIARSRATIDVAAFDLDLEPLVDALLAARRRGVMVRVVIDGENLDTPAVSMLSGQLQDWRIPLVVDKRAAFMHNKFLVIDETIVWTGSWNLTENCTFRNNNNAIRFANRQIAGAYQREFEQMLTGAFGTTKRSGLPRPATYAGQAMVEVYFTPGEQALPSILEQVRQARRSIVFLAFSFTSTPIAEALVEAARRGVHIEGVIEQQNARGTGSVFEQLHAEGVDIVADGNCYIMHHKVMIIDERIVISGSYNFTSSAERDNDENLTIIHDRTIARLFAAEYQRIRQQAREPSRCN